MKLLLCKKCNDVFNLQTHTKQCACGEVEGRYTDGQNAEYSGDAIPFAIDNHSFMARAKIDGRPSVNSIYDAWYGEGKIQCWLLVEGSPNFETIKSVEQTKSVKKTNVIAKVRLNLPHHLNRRHD